jgi:hypothetical protein
MLVFTTSIPTPRPETAEAWDSVEKPGRKIRLRLCRSSRVFASSSLMRFFSIALARMRSLSHAATVVGDHQDDVIALLACFETDHALRRLARRPPLSR